jgi:pyridoxamine 5'-phosphate oxidase
MDLTEWRQHYRSIPLEVDTLDKDPIFQFKKWLDEALRAQVIEPNAMALATVDAAGAPSCRMVLLKHVDEEGFIFFTNMKSLKARNLAATGKAILVFWWDVLERQVIVTGTARKTSQEIAADYFAKRPRGNQLGTWSSNQDEVIDSRAVLKEKFTMYDKKFEGQDVPLPPYWGGYHVVPESIEFWQGSADRLHDRFFYSKSAEGWHIDRLSP